MLMDQTDNCNIVVYLKVILFEESLLAIWDLTTMIVIIYESNKNYEN